MNLNKYTKAELINKFKRLDSKLSDNVINQRSFMDKFRSYWSPIWDFLIRFKTILLKLTLISFLIKIFKKYSLLKTIWRILNTIIVSIFGLSLLDNFGIEFITHFFKEIKIISWNIINYLSSSHFYQFLNKLFSLNDDPSSKTNGKIESMIRESNEQTTRNETKTSESIGQNNRNTTISEWLKPEVKKVTPEIIEDCNNKYYYIIGLIVLSTLTWYYFDEIKTSGSSILDWIRSFRGGDGPDSPPDTPQITHERERLEKLVKENIENQSPVGSSSGVEIQNPMDQYFSEDKGKRISSPSLEDLNSKVEDSWNENVSPTSSNETIKPFESSKFKEKLTEATFWNDNWKKIINKDILEKINFIESLVNSNSEIEGETNLSLVDFYTDIINHYNNSVDLYNAAKSECSERDINAVKELSFALRKWIIEYNSKVIPFTKSNIDLGFITDSPKLINKDDLFND
jgi:hypothetical protein